MNATLITRTLERSSHLEWFLTGTPAEGNASAEASREVFALAAEVLASNRVEVLQEKVYGLRSDREKLLAVRREELAQRDLDARIPVTFLEGPPAAGGAFAGLQIWGVAPKAAGVKLVHTVEHGGAAVGRRFNGPDFRLLVLASVDGTSPDGSLSPCAPCQAKQMFENAAALLAAQQHSFKQVARTWIYLARILDWYGEFNRVRTAHYSTAGLSVSEGAIYPASTGIQAQSDREECLMDVLAIEARAGSSLAVKPVIRSPRQDPAFSYGSAFSRAVVLESEKRKTVFISGTASIDGKGRSVHPGDAEAQCLETLLALAALLEDQGGGLEHVCQATVFCKELAVAEAYRSVSRRLRLPKLPGIVVVADVCRPELLVEIEAVAMI